MKLKDAVELFLGEYTPSSSRSLGYRLRNMLNFIWDRPLDMIRPFELVAYMQEVRQRPSIKSAVTINGYVKAIKAFFNWCVRVRLLEDSPASALHIARLDERISRDKAMPEAKYTKLVSTYLMLAKHKPKIHCRAYALILFLGDSGCRIGGAAGLQICDVYTKSRFAIVTEKGNPARRVWFGDECAAALDQWVEIQGADSREAYVFSPNGQAIRSDSLAQYFRRRCKDAKIGSYGPHSLRHRKGHQMADAKVPASVAATVLGHKNKMVTLEYYYPDDTLRAEMATQELSYRPSSEDSIKRAE